MRTRAENDEAQAAWESRRKNPIWRRQMKAEYGWRDRQLVYAIYALGGHVCLCGRGVIVADGTCAFCREDESSLRRELIEEEMRQFRLDDHYRVPELRRPLPGQARMPLEE